jgi:enoyl-CoA hydratase/carnithine racemase
MNERALEVEKTADLTFLRLARPHVRNALDNATLLQLAAALEEAVRGGARVLVVEGAGGTFCSGSDLKALAANDQSYRREHTRLGQAIFQALERAPALTVALVEGYCLGGGFELALACDLRFAVAGSAWGFPEVTIGAIPAWGGTQRLPRFVGLARAKQLLLTGQRVKAEELLSWGVLNGVFAARDEAVRAALDLASSFTSAPSTSFTLIKHLLLASFDVSLAVGTWAEALAEDAIGSEFEELTRGRGSGKESPS